MISVVRLLVLVLLFYVPGNYCPAASQEAKTGRSQECLRKALEAARDIKEERVRRKLLEYIGQDQAGAGDLASARQVAEETDDAKGAAMVLAAIGLALAHRGDGDAARATLADAMTRVEQVVPEDRRSVLYAILEAHLAAGQLTEAAQVASKFKEQFDRSSAQIHIAKAHLAAGRREEARAILHRVPTTSANSSESRDMARIPDEIWPLYVQLGDVDAALKLARAMPKGYFVRCWAFDGVGRYQAKAGNAAAAAAMFSEAFQAAKEIAEDSVRECQMDRVVCDQAETGDIDGAIKTLRLMPDCYRKAYAFEGVAAAQAKAGSQAAARSTLEEAIGMVERKLGEGYLRASALASLAKRQAKIGEQEAAKASIAKALQAARKEEYPGFNRATAFGDVARAQADVGDRSSAEKTLEEVIRLTRTVAEADFRFEAVREIAKTQVALGFPAAAQATLREILLPLIPLKDTDQGSDGRVDATVLLARAGDLDNAYEVARKIEEGNVFVAAAVRGVAAYHTMAKGPDESLALADKETDLILRSSLYHGIALGLLKSAGIEAPSFWLIESVGD